LKIAFHTLGCKVNQYESQALKEKFISKGYEVVSDDEFADVYVINTCTVTGLSDRKSRQFIRKVKKINPDCITAVVGCYVQVSPEEAKSIEGVNIIAEKNDKTCATELYSLTSFSPRKGENVRKGYLQGRFGAIPFIGGDAR
jgi:threonylcarbamoyladenosine tRNA methylthiotransferase MtaB